MRCDELVKLHCKDIEFNDEGMVANICSSKTDQFREGASLVIGIAVWLRLTSLKVLSHLGVL